MKRLLLFFALTIVTFNVYSQKSSVKRASKALENGQLTEAMKSIDQAITHKQTNLNSGTWELRGDVYYEILFGLMPNNEPLKQQSGQKTFDSYKEALALTDKSSDQKRINNKLKKTKETLSNLGNMFLAMRKNSEALDLYSTGLSIGNYLKQPSGDLLTMIGNTYSRLDNHIQAADFFMQAVDAGFSTEQTTLSALINLSLAESPDYESVMKKYRRTFPDYENLSIHELNYMISRGDYDSAIPLLERKITEYPDNVTYLVMLGSMQVSLDNEQGLVNLKKALTIDPDNITAHSDLGRYYLNKVVKLSRQIERINDLEEIGQKETEREGLLSKVSEHYETVVRLDATNRLALRVLSDIYGMLGDTENLIRIRDKIKALEN